MQASVSSLSSSKSGSLTADGAASTSTINESDVVKHYADLLAGDEVRRQTCMASITILMSKLRSTSLCP